MRGLDDNSKAGGSNETEGRASARPGHAASFVSYVVPRKHVSPPRLLGGESDIKSQSSDPLLFPEQSIG
jgi:hypothetical protein